MFRNDKVILQIRQPGIWNRYVDPTIPLTWSKRWESIRRGLPLLCIFVIVQLEMAFVGVFLVGAEVEWDKLLLLLLAFPVCMALHLEIVTRWSHRKSRTLTLRRNGVRWEHRQASFFRWTMVEAFEFAAIPGNEGARKLCLRIVGSRGRTIRKCLVLPGQREFDELTDALRQRENFEGADYELLDHEEPPKSRRTRLLPVWCLAGGLFFLVHGLPFLGLGLTKGGAEERSRSQKPGEERTVNPVLRDWITRNFETKEEVARAFLLAGITLTAAAVGCVVAGLRMEREYQKTEQRLLDRQNSRPSAAYLRVGG